MVVAAGFVITATVIAERAGAFIGSLIVTLPISTGPAGVFVALDHDADFVARAALTSVANNVPTVHLHGNFRLPGAALQCSWSAS